MQLVMAAMTTSPWPMSKSRPLTARALVELARLLVFGLQRLGEAGGDVGERERPSGRFGPAIDGTTVVRSSSSVSVNTGSGMPLTRNMPCALA